jgi:hypothetical protein
MDFSFATSQVVRDGEYNGFTVDNVAGPDTVGAHFDGGAAHRSGSFRLGVTQSVIALTNGDDSVQADRGADHETDPISGRTKRRNILLTVKIRQHVKGLDPVSRSVREFPGTSSPRVAACLTCSY